MRHYILSGILSVSVSKVATVLILLLQSYGIDQQAAVSLRSSHLGARPPECGHLFNNDNHREWSSCMGVEYK